MYRKGPSNKGKRMIITKEQREKFEDAAKPLIKWLNENCHPHVTVLVEPTGAELVEGVAAIVCEEFLRD